MKLPTEALELKLSTKPWKHFTSLGLIDTILLLHPEIVELIRSDVELGLKKNGLGRGDSPSAEAVLRVALYKELRGLTYRDLEVHLIDSRICELFTGLSGQKLLKKSSLQAYIGKISPSSLQKVFVALNQQAIDWGLEDVSVVRGDTTVVKKYIHYPTNASLVWDTIKKSIRLLKRIDKRLGVDVKKNMIRPS